MRALLVGGGSSGETAYYASGGGGGYVSCGTVDVSSTSSVSVVVGSGGIAVVDRIEFFVLIYFQFAPF